MRARTPTAVLLLAALSLPARGDDICSHEERREAEAALARGLAAEKAGRLEQALAEADRAADCSGDEPSRRALVGRVGKRLGDDAERKGRLQEAFDLFSRTGHPADADRVKMKQVRGRPGDQGYFSGAVGYFRRRGAEPQLREMREIAAANAARALADEERMFAATQHSVEELERARAWLLYFEDDRRPRERAWARGDALAREDGRRHLETALAYFRFAEATGKAEATRAKARRLGEAALGRGETALAADYLRIAGDDERADELAKRSEADRERSERSRQKAFGKKTDALEKELGL